MQSKKTERRNHPRRRGFQTQETLSLRAGERELKARVRDVADGGVGVEFPMQLPAGTVVTITGTLMAGVGQRKLKDQLARIVSCVAIADGNYLVGLAFIDRAESKPVALENPPERDYYEVLQ